jgi:hypothetical protein
VLSVVIPAHNEATVIGRLLAGLLAGAATDDLEIVVVANGCTDDTEAVAAGFGPPVTVVSTPVPSKHHALRLGDQHARAFPRLYVDADVELSAASARLLAAELSRGDVHAAAPERIFGLAGCSRTVRWYYQVWQRLPTVRRGLYGRGVIGVSRDGQRRLAELPELMGDDLAASVSFAPAQTRIVAGATVVIQAPRTASDLIRRRVRAATVIAQAREHLPAGVDAARTTRSDLVGILRANPALAPKLAVFLAVTVIARRRARAAIRSGDFSTWLRDESSRTAPTPASPGPGSGQ